MDCVKPIRLTKGLSRRLYPDGLEVACGKCYLCRIQKRREWKLRLLHENDYSEKSCFVTLTYADDYLPHNGSLVKKHLQDFFKRLRHYYAAGVLKHYSVGEYGEQTDRPHYHSIIFGVDDADNIRAEWPFGFASVGSVSAQSIEYVAGYVNKKLSGDIADSVYTESGRDFPFSLCSNGLGKRYALDHADHIRSHGFIPYQGRKLSVPRYYLKVLDVKLEHVEDVDAVKRITGLDYSFDEFYKIGSTEQVKRISKSNQSHKNQKEKNIKTKNSLKRRPI